MELKEIHALLFIIQVIADKMIYLILTMIEQNTRPMRETPLSTLMKMLGIVIPMKGIRLLTPTIMTL